MRIVISFLRMVGFGGTETYALTVAGELERLGHDVFIYAPDTGPSAEFARSHGLRVVEDTWQLPSVCDAVLAQDGATAYTMALRYPHARRVFVAHSTAFPLQSPPQVKDVIQAVVVMNDRVLRRSQQLAWHPEVIRIRQPIDLQRFCFRALDLEQRRPPRVLLLSNYTRGTRRRMVEKACAMAGCALRQVGETAVPTPTPEQHIADSEIVISLGRGALEAMASGRAAYVFGDAGGDGWVSAETYPALERDGFGGRALGHAIGVDRLAADLSQWTEELGEVGRDLACTHHDVAQHAVALLELIERLPGPRADPPAVSDELARLVRVEWDRHIQARSAAGETSAVRAEAARLREELTVARDHAADLERALNDLRATRRYRLAARIARPLDRLRARNGASR